MTLISGPSNLQVVKTTTTSAVVQWEQSQGEIDRYRLTVTPSDGAGRSKEMTVPAGRDSAHIQELEAGRLYDITLVAEKGASQSGPAVTQVTPGSTLPRRTAAAVTLQVTAAPRQDVRGRDEESRPSAETRVFDRQGQRGGESERGSGKDRLIDGSKKDSTASLITRTKPYPSKKVATNGTRPAERPAVSKKPNVPGPFRSNTTRVIPGGRKIGPGPLKKLPVGQKKKVPIPAKRPQPGVPTAGNRTTALKVTDPSKEAPSTDKTDAKNPTVISGTDSTTERESSSEGPSFTVGSKEQPDVGKDGQGNDTASVSSEPTGTVQSQDKKCLNKIKVTHVRLPVKDRGSGCRGGGQVLAGKIPDSHLTSSETDESPDLDYTPDPLHKLLTDTFDSLNITTFAVHLSKTSDLSTEAETVREQILDGLKPLSTFRSSSTAEADSQQPPHSTSSQSSPSHGPSSSSQTNLIPSLPVPSPLSPLPQSSPSPSSPSSPSSAAHSSPEKSGSSESAEAKTEHIKSTVSVASPEEEGGPPTSPRGRMHPHLPRPTDPAHGRTKTGQLQNNNNQNLRVPQRPVFYSNLNLRRKAETKHPSTGELPSTASPSSSEESLSGEVTGPVRPSSGDKDKTTAPASSGAEQDQTKISTERGKPPFRRVPPKGGYPRRTSQNFGPFNRTRPNQRLLPPPARPLKPVSETKEEQLPSSEPPAPSSSPPVSEVSNKAEETVPREEVNSDKGGLRVSTTVMTTEFNRTLRGNGGPSSHRPGNVGPFRRPVYGGRFLNRNQTNLRPPYRGPLRKPLPTRTLNGGSSIPAEGPTNQLEKQTADQIPEIPSGGQDSPTSPKGVQIRPSGRQDTAEVVPRDQIHGRDSDGKPEIHSPERRGDTLIQAPKLGAEETKIRDPNSDQREEKVSGGENAGGTSQGGPTTKGLDSGDPDHKPVTFSRRPSPTRGTATQHQSRLRPYLSGGLRRDNTRPNNTAKGGLYSKTAASRPPTGVNVSSPGVTREPLDNVGVTNRSLDRFTLVWDSPEGKYKNFVVTRSKVEKTKSPEKTGRKTDRGEEPGESEREDGGGEETSTTDKPLTESDKPFREVLPGSARSFLFEDLPPKTDYTVTLLGKGPGILSRLHKLVISTGPEPPTDIVFSELTENSLTVSWTKPKSPVSGFKVTYTHVEEGEPVSVSVDSGDSSVGLSKLSPGSTYEVNIISVLGLDESDPLKDVVTTLPDPPTDLRAVNVTDSTALLLWRPALAAVDKYVIVYGAGTDSELRISVSGNAAEQQLSGLEGSTTYTVTITSQLGSQESSKATTSFTTTGGSGGDGDGPRDLLADNVTPRTATLSWKPPSKPVGSYRLTYRTEDQDMKEVTVDGSLTKFNLSRLHPGSKYTVQLQAENGGVYTTAISTEFTTGTLRFPFPTDCSQELLNGIRISGELEIFPQGKQGRTMMVFCDMETDGGGWTVFQRRKDGSVDFFRGWKDYTKGFGDLSGEFWLGLENLHNLTTMTKMNLRVDMRDGAESVFAKYSTFEVARRNYKLSVGGYSGTAGDSLSYHNNRLFSTKDRDPTPFITRCAMSYRAGWWYKNCHEANLNGLYGIDVKHQGIIWTTWKGKEHSIQFVEMKMRPASFRG
ncbi:tenascin-like isoform X1 [Xyrichtys novacula]|nr:tenascin-like isoform X1 [Xyrichtys novacula]